MTAEKTATIIPTKHSSPNSTQPSSTNPNIARKNANAISEGATLVKRKWIKKHLFEGILTVFTVLYAVSFIGSTYVTERAYITFGRADGVVVDFMPSDGGIVIYYTNSGRTPAREVVMEFMAIREKAVAQIGKPLPSVSHRLIPAGFPDKQFLTWGGAKQELEQVKSQQKSIGVLGRIYYQDVFHRSHCVEMVAVYEPAPINAFISGGGIGVCDKETRSVRYNRVCVPTADKKDGSWIATWEGFSIENPTSEVPTTDPAPCMPKAEASKAP